MEKVLQENEKARDRVVLVGLNSPRLSRRETADEQSMEELEDRKSVV